MRILHVIDSSGLYGAEMVLLTLAAEQIRRGEVPILLSLGGPTIGDKAIEVEARRRGIECEPLRMNDGLNFALGRRIIAVARAHRADLIHSHGYKGNILLGLLSRAERGMPVVTTLHGWTAKRTFSKLGIYRFLDQRVLSRLDGVALVNDEMRCVPSVARVTPPAVTIANGVTPASGLAPPDAALAESVATLRTRCAVVFGVVGRLSPEKNVLGLVEALAALGPDTNVGLAVLGAGSESDAIEAAVTGLGLADRVLLAGYVANGRTALPLVDALVIPSFTEGLPMILLESMAAGVPVIATRVGDIPAVLGDLGVLVPPGDRHALAQAMASVASALPRFREVAAGAVERIAQDYGAATMAERYARLYASAAKVAA